ncbi:hypothetical protein Xcel_2880 [Xylanimonas cellulosilytica DSM 15894]|uniref:Uncharacterized protein n=1 Tax=Xylanimonas cellulosilytica (strain DSM 15894 / JCM 12276 / CECT 5975 / KCTC 9989 / LMG 20990 / NBRC 107835 / XIL07) TaxID=446471 RepID=D1BYM1_XYLCX|nr:hypothetical protein Xcel_2880 [Xylanimonas cellulosilytica DSM 15894]
MAGPEGPSLETSEPGGPLRSDRSLATGRAMRQVAMISPRSAATSSGNGG